MNIMDPSTRTSSALPALPSPDGSGTLPKVHHDIDELIDQIRQQVASTTSGSELAGLRDDAQYYRDAARLRSLLEYQVEFSILVCDCERALAAAYPAPTPQEAGARKGQPDQKVSLPEGISPSTMRRIRRCIRKRHRH